MRIAQELYGVLLAYNAVRLMMHKAAQSARLDPRRLSFVNAIRIIRDAAPIIRQAAPDRRPGLIAAMLAPGSPSRCSRPAQAASTRASSSKTCPTTSPSAPSTSAHPHPGQFTPRSSSGTASEWLR